MIGRLLTGILMLMTGVSAGAPDRADPGTGVTLVADGSAASVIIYPAGTDEGREHALRLSASIEALGAGDVLVMADSEAVPARFGEVRSDLQNRPLILLGNVATNRALFRLYANYLTCCDGLYPGDTGYAVHTVVRPFGRPTCYLVVGASTAGGMVRAVDEAVRRIGRLDGGSEVILPYCHDIQLGRVLTRDMQPYLNEAQRDDISTSEEDADSYAYARRRFTHNAHLYHYSGEAVFAERARQWAMRLADRDERGIRIGDYDLENLVAAWRRVMFHPAFTAEDVRRFNGKMYETAVDLERSWWRTRDATSGIGGRHHTTGMLAWWMQIRMLLETAALEPADRKQLEQWRLEAEAYLDGLLRHYSDDLDDYQSADSAQIIASYALQSGQLGWYEEGLAHRAAQRVIGVTDNLGCYAGIQGYGEALPGWERFTLNAGLLLGSCAFVYDDESYRWPLVHYPALDRSWGALQPWGLHQFATGQAVPDEPPAWLVGSSVLRLTPYRLEQILGGDFLKSPLMDGYYVKGLAVPDLEASRAFDKLVVRGRPDPSSMYLLLQGSSAIALSVIDMNAIIRLTDQGAIWLVHNTAQRSLYFKNGVYISNGLNDDPLPAACALTAHDDFGAASLASSRLDGYRGTTWTRHLIVLRDRFALVLDQVRAEAPGAYRVCTTWRTPASAELTASSWISRQNDVAFHVVPGEMRGLISGRGAERDGATRPAVLRQNRTFDAQAGDDLFLENLLYTSGPARPQEVAVRRVAPGILVIRYRGDGRESLYLAATGDGEIHAGAIRSDAQTLLLGDGRAWLSGGSRLRLDDEETNVTDGELVLTASQSRMAERLLGQLWDAGHIPPPPLNDESDDEMVHRPAWTHSGPSARGGRVDGIRFEGVRHVSGPTMAATDWILPVLRAEPRLSAQRGSGSTFDTSGKPETSQAADGGMHGGLTEVLLSPLKGAEFVLELPSRMRIDELVLYGDTFRKTTPLPPAMLDVEIVAEATTAAEGESRRMMTLAREPSWHNLYKGHCYVFECYRARGLDLEARRLRVRILKGASPSMLLTDVQLYAAAPGPDQPVEVRVLDVNGDGTGEILSWTTDGDISCITAEGTLMWRDRRPAGIIAVDAWDIDGAAGGADGGKGLDDKGALEIFVSRTDRQIDVLNNDGSLRWATYFGDMHRRTDERFYGDGTAVYGMAAWQPRTAEVTELLFTSYFYMARLDAQGNVIDHARRAGHFTQVRAVPPGCERGGDLVMRSDIPWVGPVPLEWWSRDTGRPDATCDVLNGRMVRFDVDDFDRDGRAEALIATHEGVGLYGSTAPHTRWEHLTEAPSAGAGVIFEKADAPATIVYAREDGYVCVVGADGTVLGSTFLDEPVRCLTAVSSTASGSLVLVGTPHSLRAMRLSDLKTLWSQTGRYQHLLPMTSGDHRQGAGAGERVRVVAVTREGTLEAFDF